MSDKTCIRRPGSLFTLCTCPPCAARKRRLAKAHRAGLLPERHTAAVWELVDARLAAGWSPLAIGSAAGLPERTIRSALARRAEGAPGAWTHASERALLASAPWPEVGMLAAHGPRRRLRALARIGYSLDDLHARSGLPMMTLSTIRSGKVATVRADTHREVRELYDDLSMTPGGSARTRDAAERDRWASPLAWDDDTIDDPDAAPDYGRRDDRDVDDTVLALVLDGQRCDTTTAEREQLIPVLVERGLTDGQMAELMGTTANTVLRTRRRLGVQSSWTGVKVA